MSVVGRHIHILFPHDSLSLNINKQVIKDKLQDYKSRRKPYLKQFTQ